MNIPESHPRYHSLKKRHQIIDGCEKKVAAPAGLIAHGRGEAFDYLLGEETPPYAAASFRAAAAALLLADYPVISVNGNVAALAAEETTALSRLTGAPMEINLFYGAPGRLEAITDALRAGGADVSTLLGRADAPRKELSSLDSNRRFVDPRGIGRADLVLVPLEDGDRAEALVAAGKKVITIDLNPLSRTSRRSSITLVDELSRALKGLRRAYQDLSDRPEGRKEAEGIVNAFNNQKNLEKALAYIRQRLTRLEEEMRGEPSLPGLPPRPRRAPQLRTWRQDHPDSPPLAMLTAYDFPTARQLEKAGIDLILVGDSLGNVVQGRSSTREVTLEQMVYHTEMVCRGAPDTLVIADLPRGSYEEPEQAIQSSRRLIEVGAGAVKLEGHPPGVIPALLQEGIPVMGHLGLLPQTAGAFKVQAREEEAARRLVEEAAAMENEGICSLVLECIPSSLGERVTRATTIPTIGIGAGPACSGQVLVINDLLGMTEGPLPRFVRPYGEWRSDTQRAAAAFAADVHNHRYPAEKEQYR